MTDKWYTLDTKPPMNDVDYNYRESDKLLGWGPQLGYVFVTCFESIRSKRIRWDFGATYLGHPPESEHTRLTHWSPLTPPEED